MITASTSRHRNSAIAFSLSSFDSSGGGTAMANKSDCVRSGIFVGVGYEMIEDGTKLKEGGVKRNPRCGNNRDRTSLWGVTIQSGTSRVP